MLNIRCSRYLVLTLVVLLLVSCSMSDRPKIESYEGYYQITDTSVLNQTYVRCEVSGYDTNGLIADNLLSYLQYGPQFIRFSQDSLCWLTQFAPGCWEYEERIRHRESYDSSLVYCRNHEFYPWIRTAYSIEKSTNFLKMEYEMWPLQRANSDVVYQIVKLSMDEIQIKRTHRDVLPFQWVILHYRAVRLNPKYRHTDLPNVYEQYFCCYDSLLAYIQERRLAEGLPPYKRPIRHDHNNPEINNSEIWYQYFPKEKK